MLTNALDGENAWGAYREDARPFLHALFRLLESDQTIQTVTVSEYIDGNPARHVAPHPLTDQESGHDEELDALFHAHIARVYEALGEAAPPAVTPHQEPPTVIGTPTSRPTAIARSARLLVRTRYGGRIWCAINGSEPVRIPLVCVRDGGGPVVHYQRGLGPFPPGTRHVRFRVELVAPPTEASRLVDAQQEHVVRVADPGTAPAALAPAGREALAASASTARSAPVQRQSPAPGGLP